MQRFPSVLVALTAALAVAGCGSAGSTESTAAAGTSSPPATTSISQPAPGKVEISTETLSGLGTVLVDGQGHALYIFLPDKHKQVTCLSTCAQIWPPVKLLNAQKPTISRQVKSSLVGSDSDSEGGRVLTYAGWPLYTYISDSAPGAAAGQALDANGGLWYVLSPSGAVITKTP